MADVFLPLRVVGAVEVGDCRQGQTRGVCCGEMKRESYG